LGVKILTNQEQVFVGRPFRFEVQVSTDSESPPKPTIPTYPDLIIQPESSPPSQTMSIDNGKVTKSRSFGYVAQAQKVGTFVLEGIQAGGVVAAPVIVQAVAQGAVEPGRETEKRALFVEAKVDKNEVFQGEQIVFEYTIYWNIEGKLSPQPVDLGHAFKPFLTWEKDLQISGKETIVGGRRYMKALMRRVVLFPLDAGEFQIPAIRQEGALERSDPRDPFSGFFGGRRESIDRYAGGPLLTDPIEIAVHPVPEQGRPASFAGAVGQYTFRAKLNKNEAAVGESLTLSLAISGDGNVDSLAPPMPKLPDWVETYDPERTSNSQFKEDTGRLHGTVQWDIILIPRRDGTLVFEPIEFSFFDPGNKRFLTLKQGPFRIEVTPDDGQAITYMQGKRKRLRVTGTDFRHIHPARVAIGDEAAPGAASITYWGTLACPWGIYFALFAYRRRQEYLEQNPDVAGKIRVRSETKNRLANAAKYLTEGGDRFYGELENAIHDHLSAHLGTSTRGLTRDQLIAVLRSLNPDLRENLVNLLARLESLRYAPVEIGVPERQAMLHEVRVLLGKVKG
jgi:hypothetical protein